MVDLNICRCYYSEVEEDMLHILYCKNYNFIKFRVEVMNILQSYAMGLSNEDILLLYLLEGLLHEEYLNLPNALIKVTEDLCRFRLRNL